MSTKPKLSMRTYFLAWENSYHILWLEMEDIKTMVFEYPDNIKP